MTVGQGAEDGRADGDGQGHDARGQTTRAQSSRHLRAGDEQQGAQLAHGQGQTSQGGDGDEGAAWQGEQSSVAHGAGRHGQASL